MSFSTLANIRLAGVASAVPKAQIENRSNALLSAPEVEKIIKAIGVEKRRLAPAAMCTSDLCAGAAERLLTELNWKRSEVEALIFVSQTPDYILPATSILLQNRLGLGKSCMAFDVNLGCSGYVYGLAALGGIMSSLKIKKGLLLAGDTLSKITSERDRSVASLFGDAGSATALEYSEEAHPIYFDLASDGKGWKAIRIPGGGYRNQVTVESLAYATVADGIIRNECQLALDGAEVFNFSIATVPKTVQNVLAGAGRSLESIDYFLFHQANMMMNEIIRKKLKLPEGKVPYSLRDYGNTSSATIPLTMTTGVPSRSSHGKLSWIMCGFGVGLSWGTALIETEGLVCPPLVEMDV